MPSRTEPCWNILSTPYFSTASEIGRTPLSLEGGRLTFSFPQRKLQKGLKFFIKIWAKLPSEHFEIRKYNIWRNCDLQVFICECSCVAYESQTLFYFFFNFCFYLSIYFLFVPFYTPLIILYNYSISLFQSFLQENPGENKIFFLEEKNTMDHECLIWNLQLQL